MELSRILIQELKEYQVIELREVAPISDDSGELSNGAEVQYGQVEGGRSFPIVIGLPEAQAIQRRLQGVTVKRPQTHDLLSSILASLGAKIEAIYINDLSEHTFFAQLHVRDRAGTLHKIDARPSDAVALVVGSGAPIFVEQHVLDSAQSDDAK